MGDLQSALGDHTAALAAYRKLLALRPDGPSWHALVARELATIGGHRDEALVEYEEAVALEENVGWRAGTFKSYNSYRQSIGLAEMTLPEIVASRNARFRQAVGTPAEQQARVEVLIADAERLAAKRNFSDATALLRDAIALAPDRADLYEKMADWNNHSNERIALLREAVGVEPTPARWARLGKEQLANFDYDGAIDSYRKASEMDPASAQGHADLASGYMMARRSKEAMGEYEHALDLDPSSDANWYSYNRLRAEAGLPQALSPKEQQAAAARAAAAPVATKPAEDRDAQAVQALVDSGLKILGLAPSPAPAAAAAPACVLASNAAQREIENWDAAARRDHGSALRGSHVGDVCGDMRALYSHRRLLAESFQRLETAVTNCPALGASANELAAIARRGYAAQLAALAEIKREFGAPCQILAQ